MKLAFIGLGNMGAPMAANLIAEGYEVYGLNRSKEKERLFAEAGGKVGYSLAELVSLADVILTCLPMPEDVDQVYLGDAGVIANGKQGLLLVDFSTVSPAQNRKIYELAAERKMHYLDAPVSGGTVGAKEGTLSVMVGGDPSAYAEVLPILEVVGKNVVHVGGSGSGSVVKLLNQLMVGIHTQAVAEAFRLAERTDVKLSALFDILNGSFAQSRIMDRHYRQYIAADRFEGGFALKLLHKDMHLVKQMADELGSTLPLGKEVLSILHRIKETSFAGLDMSAMFAFHQREATQKDETKTQQKYFAVLLPMLDEEKSRVFRPQHLAYLEEMRREGRIFVNGRFVDGAGGMVIYKAKSVDEVQTIVANDPYIINQARSYEIHEWDMVL